MKSAQNELKIDFPGFQTMGMNVAMSEFEYHEPISIFFVPKHSYTDAILRRIGPALHDNPTMGFYNAQLWPAMLSS